MKSQFVPGVLGLLQPVLEGGVHHITLPAQVTGCLEQDSVHQGLQRQGVVPLLVSLLHVGVGEVQPVFQTHGAETGPTHSFTAYVDLAWGCGGEDKWLGTVGSQASLHQWRHLERFPVSRQSEHRPVSGNSCHSREIYLLSARHWAGTVQTLSHLILTLA